jgi:hypothetical protein
MRKRIGNPQKPLQMKNSRHWWNDINIQCNFIVTHNFNFVNRLSIIFIQIFYFLILIFKKKPKENEKQTSSRRNKNKRPEKRNAPYPQRNSILRICAYLYSVLYSDCVFSNASLAHNGFTTLFRTTVVSNQFFDFSVLVVCRK